MQIDALFDLEFLDPYFEAKASLEDATGISFGVDYTTLGLTTTDNNGNGSSASGIARFYGAWELLGRGTPNTGALVFKVEHRHAYTAIPASGLGFDVGYAGLIGTPFNDQGARVTNLYWRQRFGDGHGTVIGGFLDTSDYVDAFALGSPWLHYTNFVFSTGSATIGLPDDATFGIAGAMFLTDNIYVIAGLADANGDSNEVFSGFETFFGENEYFSSVEVGWTSARERLIFDNIHATFWHTDGSGDLGIDDGWGVVGSASWYVREQWLPFLRGGYSKDGGALLEASVSAGIGWQPHPGPGRDLLAVGVNWGRPSEASFGKGADDQITAEFFYRFNVGEHLAITPDVQVIFDPALDPSKDVIGVLGLRARLAL
ncbi:carbohydrate porin [Limibaculum sp. FT325]|uniref:carbohydrate porin n=1 Tax=Thermohalobaculum sediminis TaxID=2939436 RepID=UPI0020BEB454|nr:carbohydrate porin [Limibaculum sediminis]MCL5778340.1 carbohydrate porin [Limibaculum sediminis]